MLLVEQVVIVVSKLANKLNHVYFLELNIKLAFIYLAEVDSLTYKFVYFHCTTMHSN